MHRILRNVREACMCSAIFLGLEYCIMVNMGLSFNRAAVSLSGQYRAFNVGCICFYCKVTGW